MHDFEINFNGIKIADLPIDFVDILGFWLFFGKWNTRTSSQIIASALHCNYISTLKKTLNNYIYASE